MPYERTPEDIRLERAFDYGVDAGFVRGRTYGLTIGSMLASMSFIAGALLVAWLKR